MKRIIKSQSSERTKEIGRVLGQAITSQCAIALTGDLGAGKTTFTQGFAKGLEVPEAYYITSPTYNIINEYPGRLPLFHLDLYRLGSADELEYLGLDDIIAIEGVMIVEWPELLEERPDLITFDLTIALETDDAFDRVISLISSGLEGANLLRNFSDFN